MVRGGFFTGAPRALLATGLFVCAVGVAQAAQTEYFAIKRFDIEGSQTLPRNQLDRLVAPFIGDKREFADIQRALEAIEVAYRKQGFSAVQVRIPEQELTGGVVRLQVVETVIDRVSVSGTSRWHDPANVRAALPALVEGATPNTRDLSAQLALANENPSRQLEAVLGIGATEGKADMRVKAESSNPLRLSATLDNTGSESTGRHRLGLAVQHANVWNRDHVVSVAWQTSPEKPDKVDIYSLSYRLPVYSRAGAFDLIAAKSSVDAGSTPTTAGNLAFAGRGTVVGLNYTQALPRQGDANHKLQIGWSIRAYDNTCTLGSFGSAGCGAAAADVTLRPLSLGYTRTIVVPGRSTEGSLSVVANLPGGGHGADADFQSARPSPTGAAGARARYQLLRGQLNHLQMFAGDWQLRLTAQAQWSPQALLSQEQIGLAGSGAVRGFLEREVARDCGVLVNAEAYTPSLVGNAERGQLRALAFIDAATGSNQLLAGETQPQHNLASWGLGLRYARDRNVFARLDLAQVLTANGAETVGHWRGHFSLMVSF